MIVKQSFTRHTIVCICACINVCVRVRVCAQMGLNIRHLAADVAELQQSVGQLLSQSQSSSGNLAITSMVSMRAVVGVCVCVCVCVCVSVRVCVSVLMCLKT